MTDVSAIQIVDPQYQKLPRMAKTNGRVYAGVPEDVFKTIDTEKTRDENYLGKITIHGDCNYIDPSYMNQEVPGHGGFITDTFGTMLDGYVAENFQESLVVQKITDAERIAENIAPVIKALPPSLKRMVDISELDPEESGEQKHGADPDFKFVMDQPAYAQNWLLDHSKEMLKLTFDIIKQRGAPPENDLLKASFDVFSIPNLTISKSVQTVLDKTVNGGSQLGSQLGSAGFTDSLPESSLDSSQGKFPNKFPDEHHAYSVKKKGYYSYLGPGTHYNERQQRGDQPINGLDRVAMIHDGEYQNFFERLKLGQIVSKEDVRTSDNKLLAGLRANKSEEQIVAHVAILVIENKIRLEDLGFMDYLKFIRVHQGVM